MDHTGNSGNSGNGIVLTTITISAIVNPTYMEPQGPNQPNSAQIDKSSLIFSDINHPPIPTPVSPVFNNTSGLGHDCKLVCPCLW